MDNRVLGQDIVTFTDSPPSEVQEPINTSLGIPKQIQFETELPVVVFSGVLQVYRQSVSAPVHAVGDEIWLGTEKEADITLIHFIDKAALLEVLEPKSTLR